jgi:hypothetical protein
MPWGDDATRFLKRVMAWPASDSDAGVVNLHWTKPNTKNPKAPPYFNGKPFRHVDHMVSHAEWRHNRTLDTKDLYFCTSLQATTAKGKDPEHPIALRNMQNTLSSKCPTQNDTI